jgi:hypothetical protein
MDESFHKKRLRYRTEFVTRWPNPLEWFVEPLPERIGCLSGDKQAFPTQPVSFRARTYLYYLAVTDRLRLDYEFLLAISNMRVAEAIAPFNVDFGLNELLADSVKLGYARYQMRSTLCGILPRIAMHTGIRTFDALKQNHLTDLQ